MTAPPVEKTILAAALGYSARGWKVLPVQWPVDGRCCSGKDCGNAAKHPLTKHGKDDATTDADAIRAWWKRWPLANVGVTTGAGLLVVDVDPRHGGDESLRDLEREVGKMPETVTALTGSGGQHLFFAVEQGYKSKAGALGPGLDVRSGGGYVVAPPSRHVSGRSYEWEVGHAPDEIDLAPLPDAIAARLKEGGNRRRPAAEVGDRIPEGQRHDILLSLGGSMRRRGMSGQAIAAALLAENESRCDPPLPEAEVDSISVSVGRYPSAEEESETAPEPAGEPPELAAVLEDVVAFIRRYVVLTAAQVDALALWLCHTHAVDAAETTPYISITSPEKRSGKSLAEEVLSLLAARSWLTGRVTAAVLIRKVASKRPTLLLDESDAAFRGEKEYAETLRAVLNAGYRRGGVASLCVKAGADFELRDFSVFGAKAFAGIGSLPDTVADRSISIRMKRKAPNETVARFRWRAAREEADPIKKGLAAWTAANIRLLEEGRPDIPPELDDRAQDGWEPLLAIADAAGGEWPMRSRRAALLLSAGDARDDDSLGVRLLQDVRSIFVDQHVVDRLPSAALVDALVAMEEAPWGDLKGKPLDPRALARRLRPYGIRPHNIRLPDGTVPKGYDRGDFDDAWSRYVPIPEIAATRATSATKQQPRLNLDDENVADVAAVAANTGIEAPPDDDAPAADSGADQPWPDGADEEVIPPEFTGKQHYVVALGIELDFPNIHDRGGGIPAGRRYYLAAARTFSDADIEKAVVALEAVAAERRGN